MSGSRNDWKSALAAACFALAASFPFSTSAEQADYGQIELTGLARDVSWPLNAPGETYAMVCNVNGDDGFLTIREQPGATFSAVRSLKRLAHVKLDTRRRHGSWVRVMTAHRTFTPEGTAQEYKDLPVSGWAHDGYLCDFIDYPAEDNQPSPNPSIASLLGLDSGTEPVRRAGGKPAQCEWDNGTGGPAERYACEFKSFGGNGSFSVIRNDGYELMLTIDEPGQGTVVEFLDGRRGYEYGRFIRSQGDPACWIGAQGQTQLCAR